ncbi:MAG: GNAT family N-acetyltransferase [Flavobacteriales bacterium]|nr:GNAT family N-acetyltransferase [Flavobacteriales bacterium]
MVHIQTDRLNIRDIEASDVEGIFVLDSDPEVLRYIGTPVMTQRAQAEQVIAHIRRQYQKNGIGRWAMELRSTGEFIGWTGLKWEQDIRPFPYYDLGYRLIRKYWGQGYATESARASLRHGFEVLGYPEICAAAEADNLASNRILRKIGMKQGEPFTFEGKVCNWYALKKEEA